MLAMPCRVSCDVHGYHRTLWDWLDQGSGRAIAMPCRMSRDVLGPGRAIALPSRMSLDVL